jgi:hypothetical protein
LIVCIIEKPGPVQEVMSAARQAGAAEVLILPEKNEMPDKKEVLFVVTDCSKIPAVLGVICKMPVFNDPGNSIFCTSPGEQYFTPGC